ncbi:MAG: ATP-binding protein [Alphaproteobacteria bacterium]|nr:ATP-binding protein [Alphaproteobacteria bacterium]
MINRWITPKLQKTLEHSAAVALLGARQNGKTTLATKIAQDIPSLYLDLESPKDLLKLSDPFAFLSLHQDKLVILDEIQRVPELFMTLRGIIDENRRQGRKYGQFLLLGSASMDLLRQSSESLAGRISYIELSGLNLLEVPSISTQDIQKLWLKGGFPESYLAPTDAIAMEWIENLIRSYLERDIPQMDMQIPAARLRRLWTMLCHLQGEPVNFSKIGGSLEVDAKTASRYTDILIDLFLVRRLNPWHQNAKKRLVKSPRFYVRDTGILHNLLGIYDMDTLFSNPVLGKSFEGFVIENILSICPSFVESYFYRTAAGSEIDLVLRFSAKETWAIEIKHSSAPKITPHFHEACQEIEATHKYVVYPGNEEFPITHNTIVTPLVSLMKKISNRSNVA